jgi:hypothetical protein
MGPLTGIVHRQQTVHPSCQSRRRELSVNHVHCCDDAHRKYARHQRAHQGEYDDDPFRQALFEIHSLFPLVRCKR